MLNKFCKSPLYEVSRRLSRVAGGLEKANLVIKNARLVNVCTAEIQEHIDVAIACGRIALVGEAAHCIGAETIVIDAGGQFIAPGFMDGHMHIESSLVTPSEFARAVIPHGTVAVCADPHEICNVCGLDGVKAMISDAKSTPLKVMMSAPSCVPAVPSFEDTGASIDADGIKEMLSWDGVMGLGEMMNFSGVINGDERVHAELSETLKADQIITGHYPPQETGKGLNAYIASGARCCHESTRAEDVLEKMRRGMYAQIRYGSAWRDMPHIIGAVLENHIDDRFACLVTDDTHPETLVEEGHIDNILRLAIGQGLNPVKAIQYVTINTASCLRMEHEMGSITPGKCADIVFFDDLMDIHVTRTIIDGEIVFEDGAVAYKEAKRPFPKHTYHTMHVGGQITKDSFAVRVPKDCASQDSVRTRVIEIVPERTLTTERFVSLPVAGGMVSSAPAEDVIKMAVLERHHKTGTKGIGFVKGFGLKRGAMAQTFAHDAHNLLVAGTDDEDMALAARTLIECGGGMCAVLDGAVLAIVPLPIAGLMSDKSVEEVAGQIRQLDAAWKTLGCTIPSPFMTMALVPLACIPQIRLTNRGLVDCRTFRFLDLFENK